MKWLYLYAKIWQRFRRLKNDTGTPQQRALKDSLRYMDWI